MKSIILTVAMLLLSTQCVSAETVLFDSQGFENYALGTMTDGQEGWAFTSPLNLQLEVEDLDDGTYENVMRFHNTASSAAASQVFAGQTSGLLTISFDMKASSVTTGRTLVLEVGDHNNLVMGNSSSGLAAYIGWGVSSGKIRYLHPVNSWQDLMDIDTDWHHVDVILDLDNKNFDFNLDGGGAELVDAPWWSSTLDAAVTPINEAMFTAYGNANTPDFMVDNLVISQVPEPSTLVLLGVAFGGLGLVWRRRRG